MTMLVLFCLRDGAQHRLDRLHLSLQLQKYLESERLLTHYVVSSAMEMKLDSLDSHLRSFLQEAFTLLS